MRAWIAVAAAGLLPLVLLVGALNSHWRPYFTHRPSDLAGTTAAAGRPQRRAGYAQPGPAMGRPHARRPGRSDGQAPGADVVHRHQPSPVAARRAAHVHLRIRRRQQLDFRGSAARRTAWARSVLRGHPGLMGASTAHGEAVEAAEGTIPLMSNHEAAGAAITAYSSARRASPGCHGGAWTRSAKWSAKRRTRASPPGPGSSRRTLTLAGPAVSCAATASTSCRTCGRRSTRSSRRSRRGTRARRRAMPR